MAAPLTIPGIPAIKDFIGVPLGPTSWVEVSQAQIDAFAEATGDRQWIHVDTLRAKQESPFGQTIAHGYLTISLAPALLGELLVVEGSSIAINSGLDKLRLPTPVPAGSRVRLAGEIKSARNMPGGAARVVISLQFEVEGAKRSACIADAIYVYMP